MIKKNWLILFLVLSFGLFTYYLFSIKNTLKNSKIVIVQTASHPALDSMVQSITEHITSFCQAHKYDIELKNGNGSIINLDVLAQEIMHDELVKKIVAIGSPALQSLISCGVKYNKQIPIMFGAVTNPNLCHVNAYKYVEGISDQIDFDAVKNLLAEIGKDKKIGFLYCVGDAGSEYTLSKLDKDDRYVIIPCGCGSESEVMQATESACQKSDILFIPTDNIIASSINTVFGIVKKYNTKLFMTDKTLFQKGGDYFCGIDYREQGIEIANKIKREGN